MPLSIVTVACCSAMAVLALLSGVIKSTTSNTRDRLNEITKEEERLTAEEEVLPTLRAEEIVPPRVTVSVPREDKENEKTPVKPKLTPLYAATSKRPALRRVNLNVKKPEEDDSALKESQERRRQLMARIQNTLTDVSKTHNHLYGEVAEIRRSYACTATASHVESEDDEPDALNNSICSAPPAMQRRV